jgi:hypothetical protein
MDLNAVGRVMVTCGSGLARPVPDQAGVSDDLLRKRSDVSTAAKTAANLEDSNRSTLPLQNSAAAHGRCWTIVDVLLVVSTATFSWPRTSLLRICECRSWRSGFVSTGHVGRPVDGSYWQDDEEGRGRSPCHSLTGAGAPVSPSPPSMSAWTCRLMASVMAWSAP